MRKVRYAALTLAALALSACAGQQRLTQQQQERALIGAGIGAAAGALIADGGDVDVPVGAVFGGIAGAIAGASTATR